MLQLYARPFLEAHRLVIQVTGATLVDNADKLIVGDDFRNGLNNQLVDLEKQLDELQLRMTLKAAKTLRNWGSQGLCMLVIYVFLCMIFRVAYAMK